MVGWTLRAGCYSQSVSVKTSTSGAGATSVVSYNKINRLTFNFCQNSSKGRGVIYAQVGDSQYDSIVVMKPITSGSGVYLRDSVIMFPEGRSGKVKFWVTCTENAININSLTISCTHGGSNPYTVSTYKLVTDISQLCDSDRIIIGVKNDRTKKIMGFYDETVIQNNIHALTGNYSADRTEVAFDNAAVYMLVKSRTSKGEEAWVIVDNVRYE